MVGQPIGEQTNGSALKECQPAHNEQTSCGGQDRATQGGPTALD